MTSDSTAKSSKNATSEDDRALISQALKTLFPPNSPQRNLAKRIKLLAKTGSVKESPVQESPLDKSNNAFAPCYRAFFDCSDNEVSALGWNGHALPLYPCQLLVRSVQFAFRAESENFSSIEILFGTYARENRCDLKLEIFLGGSIGEHPERVVTFPCDQIINNQFTTFTFPPIPNSKGKWITLRLSSPNADRNNNVAVWGSVVEKNSGLWESLEAQSGQRSLVNFTEHRNDKKSRYEFPAIFLSPKLSELKVAVIYSANLLINSALGASFAEVISGLKKAGVTLRVTAFESGSDILSAASDSDITLFFGVTLDDRIREVVTERRLNNRLTVAVTSDHSLSSLLGEQLLMPLDQDELNYVIKRSDDLRKATDCTISLNLLAKDPSEQILRLVSDFRVKALPKVSVVSSLYRKESELPYFLETLRNQTYRGQIEIVLVDDCSPHNDSRIAREHFEKLKFSDNFSIKIFKNDENLGNCKSRLRGIAASSGEILVIIDADCLLNTTFVAAHVQTHRLNGSDVVIGPLNLESHQTSPPQILNYYSRRKDRVLNDAKLQDLFNRESFLNCVTRNFSIRRSTISEDLFDPDFSYSASLDSGFGWEDVEMGYRLYARGARVSFTEDAYSIHITDDLSLEHPLKPVRSMKNFRRLLEKHPEIARVARRWVNETYRTIYDWNESKRCLRSEDSQPVEQLIRSAHTGPAVIIPPSRRRLRILSYRWHCPHQYELYKLPHDFVLASGVGTKFTDVWNYEERPLRENVRFADIHSIQPDNFDLAILHFDENVLHPENCNGILGSDWGNNFKYFVEHLRLPKIAICHGTPQFYGQYKSSCDPEKLGQIIESSRSALVNYLGNTLVILNSHQAMREWKFNNSKVIWHGFDPTEFPPARYDRGILSLGRSMAERPYYRGLEFFNKVSAELPIELRPSSLQVDGPVIYAKASNEYAKLKFRNYVDAMRDYSIYFNPTLRSPMPRARGEAMLCGLVPVSCQNHDVEQFIIQSENGFYSNSPSEIAEFLKYLAKNPHKIREIGSRARATAMDLFNHDRYLSNWSDVIKGFGF